jgi:hypothetical protein
MQRPQSTNPFGLGIEDMTTLLSTLSVLLQRAMDSADTYVTHAGRNLITPTDITFALQHQCMRFCDTAHLMDTEIERELDAARAVVMEMDVDDDDEESGSDEDEGKDGGSDETESGNSDAYPEVINDLEDNENFSRSTCTCGLCAGINLSADSWSTWQPRNVVELALKTACNKASAAAGF